MDTTTRVWLFSAISWALASPRDEILAQGRENELLSALGMASNQEPDSEWTEIFDRLWRAVECAGDDGPRSRVEELAIEHTRLFFGPPFAAVSPYEHSYREDGVAVTSCASVEACYRQSGFGLKDEFHDLPDHICAELDHAAILIAGDRESDVAAFRSEHLQGLLEGFSAKLLQESEHEVLRSIAEAIRALAAEEDWCCADAASKELQR